MDMNSFYGGQPGQDFTITYIFTSKNGATESLKSDLQRGWQSLIPVGSIVAISYGLPGDKATFEANKQKDIDAEKKSYNSTLWRKEYNENGEAEGNGAIYTIAEANGLRYRMIASMTGNVPAIRVQANNSLHANEVPKAEIVDPSDVDSPLIEFSFPVEQLLALGNVTLTGANGRVDVELDDSDIDHPKLDFWLPQSQKFEKTYVVWVDAGTPNVPKVEILLVPEPGAEETGTATELTPILKFTLPKTPAFLAENLTSEVLDANEMPRLEPDLSDPNFPKLKFYLPQSQVMGAPTTQVIAPDGRPQVTLNSTHINTPFLEFQLPRGIEFYYGNKVGAREEKGFQVTDETFVGYGVGDYYVHLPSGYLYKVVGVNGTTVTFDYLGCLQAPKPTVFVTPLDAFLEGEPNNPTVERDVTPEGWTLTFGIPKGPKYAVNEDIEIEPAGTASVSADVTDNNTLTFTFKIPRGSRLFTGDEAPTDIPEAKSGDFYLDASSGDVYLYNGATWDKQEGNLRGPVGKTLNIVADYRVIVGTEVEGTPLANTLADGTKYIKFQQGPEKVYSPEEIFAITWIDEEKQSEISYWQYYIGTDAEGNEIWGRVQLTGGTAGLLSSEYIEDQNKAYTTTYVNSLITATGENKDRTAYNKTKIEELLSWGNFEDIV